MPPWAPSAPARPSLFAKRPEPPGARALVLTAAASLAVLALGAVLVSDQTYLVGETAVVEALNAVPTAVGWPFRVVMQLGTLWVGAAIAAYLLFRSDRFGWAPGVAVALSALLAFRTDNVLKDVIERPRPSAVIDGIDVREGIDGFGFPSGHTTMAVAIVAALHPVLSPRARVVAWTAAAVTAVTRLHVAAHWPMDLVGGLALGLALASIAWLVVLRAPRFGSRGRPRGRPGRG